MPHEAFAERMKFLRAALGSRGRKTSGREWAAELGVPHGRLAHWETGRSLPRRGAEELVEALGRHQAVATRGLDARALAAWAFAGGERPPLVGPATLDDRARPGVTAPQGVDLSQPTPFPGSIRAEEISAAEHEQATRAREGTARLTDLLRAVRDRKVSPEEAASTIVTLVKAGVVTLVLAITFQADTISIELLSVIVNDDDIDVTKGCAQQVAGSKTDTAPTRSKVA